MPGPPRRGQPGLRAAVDSWKRWTPDYDDVADFYQRAAAIATPCDVLASYTFLRVLRSVRGLRILDLATGEGRSARLLMAQGAACVLGVDISPGMIHRTIAQNTAEHLSFQVLDARDEASTPMSSRAVHRGSPSVRSDASRWCASMAPIASS